MRVARKNLSLLGTRIARDCDLGIALGFVGGVIAGRPAAWSIDVLFSFVSKLERLEGLGACTEVPPEPSPVIIARMLHVA